MRPTSNKIVFFGNERLATGVSTAAPTLRGLLQAGYTVTAIVSHQEHSQSRRSRPLEVAQLAAEYTIPLFLPKKPADIAAELASLQADIGVLVAYGKIVPQSIIDLFPRGIVNIHPSNLPHHRGPTPIESVLINGEARTAVSLMQLSRAMDAGPVYAKKHVETINFTSKQTAADTLLTIGSQLLLQYLPGILDGSVMPQQQNDAEATYDKLITKLNGTIDWTKSAQRLAREVKAYAIWPKSTTQLGSIAVTVTAAEPIDSNVHLANGEIQDDAKKLIIGCGTGALEILSLVPAGKKEMSAAAFLAGYRQYLKFK